MASSPAAATFDAYALVVQRKLGGDGVDLLCDVASTRLDLVERSRQSAPSLRGSGREGRLAFRTRIQKAAHARQVGPQVLRQPIEPGQFLPSFVEDPPARRYMRTEPSCRSTFGRHPAPPAAP
ncbi:MAG TPA: hypothetical protein VJ924_09345 [Alphaproteobacteria bacterium]|nr:hypothetical protein [Alphaproteobacteria bacterium]